MTFQNATQKTKTNKSRLRKTMRRSHLNTFIYDVAIVGGGIGGLYTAYRLLKRAPNTRVLVLEKSPDVGGRVYTYDGFDGATVEAGAGRFSNHHVLLRKLIRELGLSKQVVRIPGGFSYMPSGGATTEQGSEKDVADVIRASRKTSVNELRAISFIGYATKIIGKDRAQHIVDSFGYYSELVMMNAYDAIRLMKILDTNAKSNAFYGLVGGLSQIIDGLKKSIVSSPNAEIRTKTEVVQIVEKEERKYECILADGSSIRARQCVFALPKPALEKLELFRPLKPELLQVSCGTLCRIYSQFNKTDREWLKGLKKTTTNNDLRMIIPIDYQKGVVMISYTDNKYADKWNEIHQRDKTERTKNQLVDSRVATLIHDTLGIRIAKPAKTVVFYWDCGVGYWTIGANSHQVAKRMVCPFPGKRLFVCGEHFSENHQQWMEGALETSEHVLRNLLRSK
jgi:monoamine oxidase